MNIAFKRPKYLHKYIVTQKPHSTKNYFCKKYDADKIKNQKKNTIIPYSAFPTMSIPHTNAFFLLQIRKQFNQIPTNIKIYDLRDSGLSKKKDSVNY